TTGVLKTRCQPAIRADEALVGIDPLDGLQDRVDGFTLPLRIARVRAPGPELAQGKHRHREDLVAMFLKPGAGAAIFVSPLADQINDERRVDVNHSFGIRGRSLRRALIWRSTASRNSSLTGGMR